MEKSTRLLNACRLKAVDCTPIWLMRQAGRYMPEYRAVKKNFSILEVIKNPDLATEITLQPIRAFDVDAAIIFSDLLPILEGMGLKLEFIKGDGPVIHNPLITAADIHALSTPPAQEALYSTLRAIELVKQELAGKIPLIGFAGAPFTLACYAVEGGASREFKNVKHLMHSQPKLWRMLMEKLARVIIDYLIAQAKAGADILQVFDSWVGILSPYDYQELVLPFTKQIIDRVKDNCPGIPIIYFGTGTAGILPLCKNTGANLIGVDWRIELTQAWSILGKDIGIQGNLDPMLLCAPVAEIKKQAARILDSVRGRKGHIFNLGHGILKYTPVEHVRELVDFVHEYSQTAED